MELCDSIRQQIALDANTADQQVVGHLQSCPTCAAYATRRRSLDQALSAELQWQAPPELTAALMALILTPAMLAPAAKPKRWHVVIAWLATAASITLSLVVSWQIVAFVVTNAAIQAQLGQLVALPGQWLTQVTQSLPESRYLIDLLLRARTQLVWLLLVALVWAVLDTWNPQFKSRRRQGA